MNPSEYHSYLEKVASDNNSKLITEKSETEVYVYHNKPYIHRFTLPYDQACLMLTCNNKGEEKCKTVSYSTWRRLDALPDLVRARKFYYALAAELSKLDRLFPNVRKVVEEAQQEIEERTTTTCSNPDDCVNVSKIAVEPVINVVENVYEIYNNCYCKLVNMPPIK